MKRAVRPSRSEHRRKLLELTSQNDAARAHLSGSLAAIEAKIAPHLKKFDEKFETLRRQLIGQKERLREDAEKIERAHWAKVAATLRSGELDKFYQNLNVFGPRVFEKPEVQTVLWDLWLRSVEDEAARALLMKVCPALAKLDPWRPPTLTKRQKEENKRASNRSATQTARSLTYCQRMWSRYGEITKGVKDATRCQRIADAIANEERTRGKTAKHEGIRLFLAEVKKDLANRTVRNK